MFFSRREHDGGTWAGLTLLLALALLGWAGAARAGEPLTTTLAPEEIEGRRVLVPPDLQLELEWYSPAVSLADGQIVRGWVKDDLVLLETDQRNLIAVRRSDGTERWRCLLEDTLLNEPAVSRNNVVVNVKNYLTALEKRTGDIRWRMMPRQALSNTPLVVDPPLYPKTYVKAWTELEQVFAGTWNSRFQAMTIRARMYDFVRERNTGRGVMSAPDFDIMYNWHRTLALERALVTTPARLLEDVIYFTSNDQKVHAVTVKGEEREPYLLQGQPSTWLTVTPTNCYVGARDCFLYALDRYTLKRKWSYGPGLPLTGTIYAEEAPERIAFVYPVVEGDGVHALRVIPGESPTRTSLGTAENYAVAWKFPKADGVIVAGDRRVYLGSGKTAGFQGYQKIAAVNKATGHVDWQSDSQGVRFYLEFHNVWHRTGQAMRLYAVTADNRLLSFHEKDVGTGPIAEAKAPVPPEAPKAPEPGTKAAPAPETPKAAEPPAKAAPAPETPKAVEPPAKAAPAPETPKAAEPPAKAAPAPETPKAVEPPAKAAPAPETPKAVEPPADATKADAPKADAPKTDEPPEKTE